MKKAKLLKAALPVLREKEELIPGAPVKINKKMADYIIRNLDKKKLVRIGAAAGGAALVATVGAAVTRTQMLRIALARELKKQLAPIQQKLDELEKQNEELKKELEKKSQ